MVGKKYKSIMKLARSINSRLIPNSGCVLTIGKFDAVHIGHQKILQQLVKKGKKMHLPAVVMTFAPGPEEYFRKQDATARLTTISSQYFALREQGINLMLAIPFNKMLAQTSAEIFIQTYLIERLQAKYISIGDDFRFGKERKGDYQMLKQAGSKNGFEVGRFETINVGHSRVSSTRICQAIGAGHFEQVDALLGRKFAMVGRVIHGDKRGREWGFPTANIAIKHKIPMTGVFAVTVRGINDGHAPLKSIESLKLLKGVANLGMRPTVDGMKTLLEVHLFDFNEQIYGRRICVQFVSKIRDEKKFASSAALKNQIFIDCERAKEILAASGVRD